MESLEVPSPVHPRNASVPWPFDRVREGITAPLLARFNGKMTPDEKKAVEYAFRLFQNQLLHGPIAALHESSAGEGHGTLRDALKKLFRLGE